ncbi:hypothetical protein CC1G_08091 [Coprinopsis cinerea okayama7|uniref:Uncharacterized protein n=1 Tax=Coprinopsis cinerea (strain Okayama-7 / 130 / ATCC MYA-4618 / FGSC 9003) TaxID=240176 RepID=A8NVG3_COPC7|nr:hypothetical protein CC1G_08091 [Coprinopsis cinerea okayama7\|eukprot:XP_001836706.2 hypothetical protein CC1G_08091 [Coprinopsis cinerea okayama7\
MSRVPAEPPAFRDPVISPYYSSNDNGLPDEFVPRCKAHILKMAEIVQAEEEEVSRLKLELEESLRRLQLATDEYTSCQSLLSPIRRVPTEIFSTIFIHILELDSGPRILSPQDVIQLRDLMLVCKKWRKVALVTPELWCGLEFNLFWEMAGKSINPEAARYILERWFDRAGTRSLRLALGGMYFTPDERFPLRPFLLSPHRRWHTLTLEHLSLHCAESIFSPIKGVDGHGGDTSRGVVEPALECLQELGLYFDHDELLTFDLSILPSLKRLTIENVRPPFSFPPTLRCLHIHGFSAPRSLLIEALGQLPELQELELNGVGPIDLGPSGPALHPTEAAILDNLPVTTFRLREALSLRVYQLLETGLRFPRLERCEFGKITLYEEAEIALVRNTIPTFLNHSPGLQEIDFTSSTLRSPLIAEIISKTRPLVKRILVHDFSFIANMKLPPKVTLSGLESLVAVEPPSEGLLERIVGFFGRRKECIRKRQVTGGTTVRLYVQDGWPKYILARRNWVKQFEEVGVQVATTPYHAYSAGQINKETWPNSRKNAISENDPVT